MERVQVIYRVV